MTEITLFLSESPKALKKDFLATCTILETSSSSSSTQSNFKELPQELVFDSYTRDPWSHSIQSTTSSSTFSSSVWQGCFLQSIDKRKRIPGFTSFLKQRKKAAFGTWTWTATQGTNGKRIRAIMVVPFDQPLIPKHLSIDHSSSQDILYVQYCLDETCKKGNKAPITTNTNMGNNTSINKQSINSPKTRKVGGSSNSGGGLLGNLLGAQNRTNQQLDKVRIIKPKPTETNEDTSDKTKSLVGNETNTSSHISSSIDDNPSITNTSSPADTLTGTKTVAQVLSSFTAEIEEKLIQFHSDQTQTKIELQVSLAEQTRQLSPLNLQDKQKLSMDVLKFIVNEQVDEIGMDEWTCMKEASEFSDEAQFVVYKAGHVPEDVLEDLNRGEIPDEVKQQQRAMQEARVREEKKRLKHLEEENLKKMNTSTTMNSTNGKNHKMETLNLKKRDRRTIEEIQRDQSKRLK